MATGVSSLETSLGKDTDVERVFRKFTFKCLQIIVQSRIEHPRTVATKDTTSDYFSIYLPDNPVIEEQIRRTLEGIKTYPVTDQSICVEITLVTNDGDRMFLETWDIGFNLSSLDMSAGKIQHIFTRMGVTLKSLLCATRATSAHRLAKNQGEKGGGYRLNYRFYLGKPLTHLLGDGHKTIRAGAVPTAYGLLNINVSYRTKLLISPEMAASASAAIELTDNYFMKEKKNKHATSQPFSSPQPCSPLDKRPIHLPSPDNRAESPYCFAVSPSSYDQDEHLLSATPSKDPQAWPLSSILNMEELPEPSIGAFASPRPGLRNFGESDVPFEGLMKRSIMARQELRNRHQGSDVDGDSGVGESTEETRPEKDRTKEREDEKENMGLPGGFEAQVPMEDDYVMVDKPPFAADDDPRDVKSFLGSMYRAPRLYDTTDTKITITDYLNDVEALVLRLEEDMPVLDEFCQSVINFNSTEEDEAGAFFS